MCVFFWCNPLKIFNPIIAFVSILVINLWFVFGIRDECHGNEAVNVTGFLAVFQCYDWVLSVGEFS